MKEEKNKESESRDLERLEVMERAAPPMAAMTRMIHAPAMAETCSLNMAMTDSLEMAPTAFAAP